MPASLRRAFRGSALLLGSLWALPLTAPMLAVGLVAVPFGARVASVGPMVVFTRFPFGPVGALAMGQVVLSRLASLDVRVPSYAARAKGRNGERVHLGRHELAHVRQSLALGPLFPLLYLLWGGVSARNPFERAADRYARRGRGWWPWAGSGYGSTADR